MFADARRGVPRPGQSPVGVPAPPAAGRVAGRGRERVGGGGGGGGDRSESRSGKQGLNSGIELYHVLKYHELLQKVSVAIYTA